MELQLTDMVQKLYIFNNTAVEANVNYVVC